MPQVGTGWTQYHDFLMQQAIAMMSEPDWANNPALVAQLTPIQDELRAAGETLGSGDQDIKDLFDEFQAAYQNGVAQNEQRYGQLLADANGNMPNTYNAQTGQWEQNPAYQAPLSYQQRIEDLTGAGGAYTAAQNRFDQTAQQQQQDLTTANNQFDTRAQTIGGNLSGVMGGYNSQYNDPNGILAGYNTRASTLGSQIGGVTGKLGTDLSGISSRYATRENDLKGLLSGYGDIQRQDLGQAYDKLGQQQLASLNRSGLGNSTVMSSVMGGVENQRAQDQARMEDQLRREQLGYQSQWSADKLGAQEREAMANAGYGMQGIGMNAQYGADALGAREGYASNALNAGFEQANINAGLTGDYANSLQQSALANAQMGSQAANYAGNVANVRNQLTADPLRAIEARTDVVPGLGDVFNAALQIGVGQGQQFALPGFGPQSYYQQPTQGAA